MSLPQAIVAQAKHAEEFFNSEEVKTEVVENIVEPEVKVKPEVIKEEVVTTPVVPVVAPTEDYELRFKNYKASTDNTIYELRQQNQNLNQVLVENKTLRNQVESLNKSQPKFSKEALDTFSSEELDVFNNMLNSKTEGLEGQVTYLQNQLNNQNQLTAQKDKKDNYTSFRSAVVKAIPDFKAIDTSPDFKAWIRGLDSYGKSRIESLREAKATEDVGRVVSFYNDFKQTQQAPKLDPRELNQQPDGNSTKVPNEPRKFSRVWDEPTIQAFYRDNALGKVDPKQAALIEQEIVDYKLGGN